jgi:hypothetical protein
MNKLKEQIGPFPRWVWYVYGLMGNIIGLIFGYLIGRL